MRLIALAAASIVFAHAEAAVARQSSAAASEPGVQIGIFGYQADGSRSSAAYDTEPSLDSRVYASRQLCQLGAGYKEAPAWAMHGWRFSGQVVSKNRDEAVVQVTWQRTLDSGTELALPESTVQLRIRAGERNTLDTVQAPPDSPCSITVAFEAQYVERHNSRAMREFTSGGVRTGSVAKAPGGASVSGPRVTASSGGLAAGSARDRDSWMQVQLWLVHAAPDRKPDVVHQLVRAPREGADFAFAPLSIDTPRGAVVVQVSGSFATADGQLIFVTNRSVKYLFQSSRDAAAGFEGTGRTVNAMPAPDEVLSFELPPIPGAPGAPALPNQLSVRMRVGQ